MEKAEAKVEKAKAKVEEAKKEVKEAKEEVKEAEAKVEKAGGGSGSPRRRRPFAAPPQCGHSSPERCKNRWKLLHISSFFGLKSSVSSSACL